ncbi:MAG: glycoside hydrolase family 127 protein [Anaerolineae bacterium]|nr:glycoside hydrolase family 127 protein [Anaerolineae bacterium]
MARDSLVTPVDTTRSPYAQLKPVPLTAVTLTDAFWSQRQRVNREVALPAQYRLIEETGRLGNFWRAAGKGDQPFTGLVFNDSDVYKWLEAASWTLAATEDAALAQMVNTVADAIVAAQAQDGYLNTYYVLERAGERWSNLRDHHELYCAGHFFQAAVAHYRATGETRLLTVARRFADLICETFGPRESQRQGTPGHPEIEMALVELARATGEERYLHQAQYFLDSRGQGLIGGREYHQDHLPFRSMSRLVGHAVRALYLCAGATDLYAETGEATLHEVLAHQWQDMVTRQMYITGGLGARYEGEALGADYELPNARAYAETCAGIANVMWSWRMLQLRGDAAFADVIERALYNAVLPGISWDGACYFYSNPLQSDGAYRRVPWFTCACCPPNVARLLASLPAYFYSVGGDEIWMHFYSANEARIPLSDGRVVHLVQRTRYPWDGNVTIDVLTEGEYALAVRIPDWCEQDAVVLLNGDPVAVAAAPGSYARVRRMWSAGDTLCVRMALPVRRVVTHPYALENSGRVALMRGPLLYCLEGVDNPFGDLRDVVLPFASPVEEDFDVSLLGGTTVLRAQALLASPDSAWSDRLYRVASGSMDSGSERPVNMVALPYYAWANRAPGAMQVWLKAKAP